MHPAASALSRRVGADRMLRSATPEKDERREAENPMLGDHARVLGVRRRHVEVPERGSPLPSPGPDPQDGFSDHVSRSAWIRRPRPVSCVSLKRSPITPEVIASRRGHTTKKMIGRMRRRRRAVSIGSACPGE